jgi:transcriptional regulator with XRE-family HTH domain
MRAKVKKNMQRSATFPERLRWKRNQFGYGQHELSKVSRVSVRSITDYENGKSEPSQENLRALAGALKVSMDWLVGGAASPVPPRHPGEQPPPGPDPDIVRQSLKVLKRGAVGLAEQIGALAAQIDYYESELCGEPPPTRREKGVHPSKVDAASKAALKKAAEDVG